MDNIEKHVCRYIDENRNDVLNFFGSLYEKQRESAWGHNGPAELIEDKLKAFHIKCERITVNGIHQSIIAEIGSGGIKMIKFLYRLERY